MTQSRLAVRTLRKRLRWILCLRQRISLNNPKLKLLLKLWAKRKTRNNSIAAALQLLQLSIPFSNSFHSFLEVIKCSTFIILWSFAFVCSFEKQWSENSNFNYYPRPNKAPAREYYWWILGEVQRKQLRHWDIVRERGYTHRKYMKMKMAKRREMMETE